MKNTNKLFGLIALVAVIGFSTAALSLTGCDNGGGGGTTETTTAIYEGGDYLLVIAKAEGKAAYKPATGDNYILTILSTMELSNGTITVSEDTFTFTLTPYNNPNETFTITISGKYITEINGPVILDDGTKKPAHVNEIGVWVQTIEGQEMRVIVGEDKKCTVFIDGEPIPEYNNKEHPAYFDGAKFYVWYDYISETWPVAKYMEFGYSLSADRNTITIDVGDETLILGSGIFKRVRAGG